MSDNYGYIYCMSNECMNGMVKIGITNNTPRVRARQLSNTSVPYDFEVKFGKKVKNPKEVETEIHKMLREQRISPRREFFKVSEEKVRDVFTRFQGEWWDEKCIDNENIVDEDISSVDTDDEPNEEDDKPSEDEEEDDPMTAMAKQQKHMLNEQMSNNLKRNYDLINSKVEEIEKKREALYKQIRAYDEQIEKIKQDAKHKACEENKSLQIKLDRVLVFLGEAQNQRRQRNAERNAYREVVNAKKSTFFSRKEPKDMVNQNTRFIYEQKKGSCIFKRFCIISKSENCVYECDANGTIKGVPYRSLNDFCVMVKKTENYQGSLKQDCSVVLKYYDIASQTYMNYKDLTAPLN